MDIHPDGAGRGAPMPTRKGGTEVAATDGAGGLDPTAIQALNALAAVAGLLGQDHLSKTEYDKVRCAVPGAPSSVRITQVFGTWNQACQAIGLAVNRAQTAARSRWRQAEVARLLATFLSQSAAGTYRDYARWARSTGAPSGQTVRNAFGSWSAAKTAARTYAARELLTGRAPGSDEGVRSDRSSTTRR